MHRLSTNLSFSVHSDDTRGGFMRRCHKYRISADSVHVDTRSVLYVIHMYISVFSDHENTSMLLTNLEIPNTCH